MTRKTHRRAVVAGAGSLLLAGCTDSGGENAAGGGDGGSGDGGSGDGGDDGDGADINDRSNDTPERNDTPEIREETLINERDTVQEDQYIRYKIAVDQESEAAVRATVRNGPRLDMVFTTEEEFQEFERGNRFRFNSDLSSTDTAGYEGTTTLQPGDYVYIVDNSEAIDAEPPTNFDEDPARYEVAFGIRYRP